MRYVLAITILTFASGAMSLFAQMSMGGMGSMMSGMGSLMGMGGGGRMMGGMGGGGMMGGRGGMMGGLGGGGMMGGRGGMMFNLLGPQSSYTLTLLNKQQMLRSRRDAIRAPISVPAAGSPPATDEREVNRGETPQVPLPRFNGQRRDLHGGLSPN